MKFILIAVLRSNGRDCTIRPAKLAGNLSFWVQLPSSVAAQAWGSKRALACPPALQVIGDGAITGGMAYEAMNHAGFLDKNMIVILNDNQQVRVLHHCRWLCVQLRVLGRGWVGGWVGGRLGRRTRVGVVWCGAQEKGSGQLS